MNKIKVGHYEQDGGLINLPLGFIPDFVKLSNRDGTNTTFYEWYREMSKEATGSQEGVSITEGTTADLADDGGIVAYSASAKAPTITEWTEAVATAATARTATAAGTYVKPSVASSADRGSIFECVTAGTGGSTEPVWPDSDGENVTDNSVVWKKVNVSLQDGGYQGIVVAAALQTNGQEMYYTALQANQSVDHGDVDGWTDGIDPNA